MTRSTEKTKVLVTGGAGYIGSTICSALIDHGFEPIILDNLCQGSRTFTEGRIFYEGDIANRSLLSRLFKEQGSIPFAIHCAALIVVPESVDKPELYYRENVSKSVELFAALRDEGCKNIVFSSSAAVYDVVDGFRVDETSPLNPNSPYAQSKAMMEQILKDFCAAYAMRGIALRYFNPIGADPQFRTGSYVKNPSHVLGKMLAVAQGREQCFKLTGTNWPTRDGSGIRDFIHVWDLALAHVSAIQNFERAFAKDQPVGATFKNYRLINIGNGTGVTVKELVKAFETVTGKPLPKLETGPRPGDVAGSFASAETAQELLGWKAKLPISEGIRSALEWAGRFFKS